MTYISYGHSLGYDYKTDLSLYCHLLHEITFRDVQSQHAQKLICNANKCKMMVDIHSYKDAMMQTLYTVVLK